MNLGFWLLKLWSKAFKKTCFRDTKKFRCHLKSVNLREIGDMYVCRKKCCPIASSNLFWLEFQRIATEHYGVYEIRCRIIVVGNAGLQPEGSCNSILSQRKEIKLTDTIFRSSTDRVLEKGVWKFFKSRELVFLTTSIATSQRETLNFRRFGQFRSLFAILQTMVF